MRRNFETAPKPFDIVPFETNPKPVERIIGHDRIAGSDRMTGRGTLHFKTLTPLHIGSGLWVLGQNVIREFANTGGETVIPGSSLKGAFRTIAETISPSCVCKTKFKKNDLTYSGLKECSIEEAKRKHCITCSLFGCMGYKGRVFFTDGILNKGQVRVHKIPPLYGPRDKARIYKDRSSKFRGRKFYFHGEPAEGREPIQVLEPGSVFESELRFENVSREEMGLLFTSLGIIGGLVPKIGGAKPVCLGSVQVMPQKLEIRAEGRRAFATYSSPSKAYEGEALEEFIQTLPAENNAHILNNSLARLKSVWEYPSVRTCPSIAY